MRDGSGGTAGVAGVAVPFTPARPDPIQPAARMAGTAASPDVRPAGPAWCRSGRPQR